MDTLPHTLYRAEQVREFDRLAIEQGGVSGITLMERAGAEAFELLRTRWPRARRIAVLCGHGNNGGDGYVFARLAKEIGFKVQVFQIDGIGRLRGDALTACHTATESGVAMRPFDSDLLSRYEVIVDAMLGTGIDGEVGDVWRRAIEVTNRLDRPVLALDIPSGLHPDNGTICGAAIQADATITFVAPKQGLFSADGPQMCGDLFFSRLAIPEALIADEPPASRRIACSDPLLHLPTRKKNSHKGQFGHLLVVGGEHGFGGAARLCAEAAARSGAGLVSVATRQLHVPALVAACPELMAHGVEAAEGLEPLLARADVVALGPGLGQGAWGRALYERVLASDRPPILGADALNLLAQQRQKRPDWILTPHPGEAARLLDCPVDEVQGDRFFAAVELQQRYGGIVILKGCGTLVCNGRWDIHVADAGSPGLATGGSGDLLTGILASFVAQGVAPESAAQLAVQLHAVASRRAEEQEGVRGMLASDLLPHLRRLLNGI